MKVHVTRTKQREGGYSYRFCRVPQCLGDYRIHELREGQIDQLTFSKAMTKDQIEASKVRLDEILKKREGINGPKL